MLLRSGKSTTKEYIPRIRNRRMANQPSSGEMPPPILGNGTTVIQTVSEYVPSTVGLTPALTVTQTRPILSYIGPTGPPGTPPPRGNLGVQPYVPPGFSTVWMGRDQPYGIPTAEMESLMNASSIFSEPLVSASSPLQGS